MNRLAAIALAAMTSMTVSAQTGSLGTKKDVIVRATGSGSSGLGGMQLLQMIVAMVIVVALLKWLLPKLLMRVNKRISTGIGSSIEVEETATFAGGSLLVVRARGKSLLLCVSNQGVSCLADLTESRTEPDPPAFFELVDEAEAKLPGTAVVEASDIEAALGRLARLEG